MMASGRDADTIQAGRRMLAILDYVAQCERDVGISEVSRALKVSTSTAHRLMTTLVAGGLLEQNDNHRYRLGVKLISLGYIAQERLDIRNEALPYMKSMAGETKLEVNLAKLDGANIVYIEKVTDMAQYTLNTRVGQQRPAYCRALGKILLAHCPDDQVRELVGSTFPRLTAHTVTTIDELLAQLAVARQRGYAEDREETALGFMCIAAPIYDAKGEPVAALSVSGSLTQYQAMTEERVIATLKSTAGQISRRLGYKG